MSVNKATVTRVGCREREEVTLEMSEYDWSVIGRKSGSLSDSIEFEAFISTQLI